MRVKHIPFYENHTIFVEIKMWIDARRQYRVDVNVDRDKIVSIQLCSQAWTLCVGHAEACFMPFNSWKPNNNRPLGLREVRPRMKLYGIIQCDRRWTLCLPFAQDSRSVAAVYCSRPNNLLHNALRSIFFFFLSFVFFMKIENARVRTADTPAGLNTTG